MILFTVLTACTQAPEPAALVELACHNRGEPEACFSLATDELTSAAPDYSAARKLFSMGCTVHHAPSCNALATLVRDARGGPRDIPRATNLFEVACEGELIPACVHLADVLVAEDAPNPDPARAFELYTRACSSDSVQPAACTSLSAMVRAGNATVKGDEEKADELLKSACDLSYAPACQQLAETIVARWGKDNLVAAIDIFQKACEIDANYGCFELGKLHADKKAPEADDRLAGEFFAKVCSVDSQRGCFERAELMHEERIESRPGEKEQLYKSACQSGNSLACELR